MTQPRMIVIVILSLSFAACAAWKRIDDTNAAFSGKHFSLNQPTGWLALNTPGGDALILSKDGINLQRMVFSYREHQEAFPRIEKETSSETLPAELAELYIANLKAQDENGLPSLKVLKNEPVTISGRTGFSLRVSFKIEKGLEVQVLARGLVDASGLYLMEYRAPTIHFFDRDLHFFEETFSSFKMTSG